MLDFWCHTQYIMHPPGKSPSSAPSNFHFTSWAVVCCALCPSHRHFKNLGVLQHSQAPTCLLPCLVVLNHKMAALLQTSLLLHKWRLGCLSCTQLSFFFFFSVLSRVLLILLLYECYSHKRESIITPTLESMTALALMNMFSRYL